MDHAFFVNYTNRHVDIQRVKDAFKDKELGNEINSFVDKQLESIIRSWASQLPESDRGLIPSYKGWDRLLDLAIRAKFTAGYDVNSFYDLIRCVRNIGQHFKDYS